MSTKKTENLTEKNSSGFSTKRGDKNLEKVVVAIKGILSKDPEKDADNLLQEFKKRSHMTSPRVSYNEESNDIKVEVEVSYLLGAEHVREEVLEVAAALVEDYKRLEVDVLEEE